MGRPATEHRTAVSGPARRATHVVRLICALGLLATGITWAPAPSPALTSSTITIDGRFDDWIPVRADPDNVAYDTQVPDDPDWPGQPDRDIFYVNSTFDDEYLYFCWRRTSGGVKAITFGAYLDLGGDGLLQEGEDVVVLWTVSDPTTTEPAQQNYDEQGRILHYYQARNLDGTLVYPAGDPMDHYGPPPVSMQKPVVPDWQTYLHDTPHGDGNTPDGWAIGAPSWGESYPAETMDAYMDPVSGIECEARVAWSDLGFSGQNLPPRMSIHFATGNGEDFGTANKTSLWPTDYREVSGSLTESNRGQVEDNVRGLYWLSTTGVDVDPDRAAGGAAGSTIVYEHTVTNTGNGTDTFDLSALSSLGWPVQVTDADNNPLSEITLDRESSATVYVRVTIPANEATGKRDVTTLTATSQSDPTVTDSVRDTTAVGAVTVTPDQSGSMAPGQTIEYAFTVQNNLSGSGVFDLTTASTSGFTNQVVDLDGNPVSAVALASGETTQVVVRVTVPAEASSGQQDVMTLTAREQTQPNVRATARATTTVRAGLDIEADQTGYGGIGTWVQYEHTITNSWPETRTIDVSAASGSGWITKVYAADGVSEITQVTVGPNGASVPIIVRVQVPGTATANSEDLLTVTASANGESDYVTDRTIVRMLDTYADPGYVNASREFYLTDMVYTRATGLSPGSSVYFVWRDANGTIVRTSNSRTVDTQGMAFDDYTSSLTDPTGNWTVELRSAKNDALLASSPFVERWKAEITALSANDASTVGDTVTVSSAVENQIGVALDDTIAQYVIWWDSDGNGEFGAGDLYIDTTGSPVTWDGIATVPPTHTTSGIDVAASGSLALPDWSVANTYFPNQGTYNVTMTWFESDGTTVIDEKITQFYSVPTLGWPLFALMLAVAVGVLVSRARGAGLMGGGERP